MKSLVLSVGLALGASVPAMATSAQTYTNLCSTPQSGDVAGWMITLTSHRKKYQVSFDYSEGQLMEPVTTDQVSYNPASGHLTFQVRSPDGLFRFDGVAGKSDLVGRLSDSAISSTETITLKAVPSGWNPSQFPNCPEGK